MGHRAQETPSRPGGGKEGRGGGGGEGRRAGGGEVELLVLFFLLAADLCAVIAPLVQPAGKPRSSFTSVAC